MSQYITGKNATMVRALTHPPRMETTAEAAMAVLAFPWRAMGKPSRSVAAFGLSPGTLKRMAVKDPPNLLVA